MTNNGDGPAPKCYIIQINGKDYTYSGKPITATSLDPNTKYTYSFTADFGDYKVSSDSEFNFTTKSLAPQIQSIEVGPTSLILKGTYAEGDAKIAKLSFDNVGEGALQQLAGLEPGKEYTFTFNVVTDNGYKASVTKSFTLPALQLTTLQPKCVSATCAIVAAETNISEIEPNVGFQWKKYDAPASLKPSEGYGAIYGGMMEGYLKNLQSTSYYNVRAFYKDASGNYYYGDWVTFDPNDFSYFEPTVHTYPVQNVGEDNATVRGYVLGGTDQVISQGVQYWKVKTQGSSMSHAAANSEIHTVLATGQVMTVVLTDLEPGTDYICRAFAQTEAGYKYGEEMSFRTAGQNIGGIDDIDDDATEVTVEGYYDISGMLHEHPVKGLNIVVYSDGSRRKIIVRE